MLINKKYMFCEQCGGSKRADDKFCAHCGASLIHDDQALSAENQTVVAPKKPIQYEKIGGWLYLISFGLLITPLILGVGISDSLALVSDGSLADLAVLAPGLASGVWFEIIMDSIFFLLVIYLLFLLRDKKRIFPKYFIWYMVASIGYLIIDFTILASITTTSMEMQSILDDTLQEQVGAIISAAIGSAIWIAYMLKSKRVTGTFIK